VLLPVKNGIKKSIRIFLKGKSGVFKKSKEGDFEDDTPSGRSKGSS